MTHDEVPTFVLDCSVAMAWCFSDEGGASADAVLERLTTTHAAVPSLWHLEVANALLVGERRGRLTADDASQCVVSLDALPVRTVWDYRPSKARLLSVARLAQVSVYDATYLDLAAELGVPLATLDDRIRRGAISVGVSLL